MRRVNKNKTDTRLKPSEKRENRRAKAKQEDLGAANYQDLFPQLGASPTKGAAPSKGTRSRKQSQNSEAMSKKSKGPNTNNNLPTNERQDSAPLEPTPNKVDVQEPGKLQAKTPQPTNTASPNMGQAPPLQMPPGMHPNMMHMGQHPNQNMPMPFMGQMVMMMPPQMGMRPPFMMPIPPNQPGQNMQMKNEQPGAKAGSQAPVQNPVSGSPQKQMAVPLQDPAITMVNEKDSRQNNEGKAALYTTSKPHIQRTAAPAQQPAHTQAMKVPGKSPGAPGGGTGKPNERNEPHKNQDSESGDTNEPGKPDPNNDKQGDAPKQGPAPIPGRKPAEDVPFDLIIESDLALRRRIKSLKEREK